MGDLSCPCEILPAYACSSACSCAGSDMSGGCLRCCKYGSEEQREAQARRMIQSEQRQTHVHQTVKRQRRANRQLQTTLNLYIKLATSQSFTVDNWRQKFFALYNVATPEQRQAAVSAAQTAAVSNPAPESKVSFIDRFFNGALTVIGYLLVCILGVGFGFALIRLMISMAYSG